MSENYAQTPTQQLLAKLRECETTMTKGEWRSEISPSKGYTVWCPCGDTCSMQVAATGYAKFDGLNAHGIATLKNSNPTVIAMLERVMELRAELLLDSSISAATTRKLLKFDADLDALAREALKEKP